MTSYSWKPITIENALQQLKTSYSINLLKLKTSYSLKPVTNLKKQLLLKPVSPTVHYGFFHLVLWKDASHSSSPSTRYCRGAPPIGNRDTAVGSKVVGTSRKVNRKNEYWIHSIPIFRSRNYLFQIHNRAIAIVDWSGQGQLPEEGLDSAAEGESVREAKWVQVRRMNNELK